HVRVAVGDRDLDRLEAARDEAGERAAERVLSGRGEAGGDADHVLLGDAHLEEARRVLAREELALRALREVRVENHDVRMFGAEGGEGLSERLAAGLGLVAHRPVLTRCSGGARRTPSRTARASARRRATSRGPTP